MNHIDNSKAQFLAYGNSVHLGCVPKNTEVIIESRRNLTYQEMKSCLEQSEKTLTREMLSEMARNGQIEQAFEIIWDMIVELKKQVKELESK